MQQSIPWKEKLHSIIFEADTPAGKLFDVVLLWAILLSVLAVVLESVVSIRRDYGELLMMLEFIFTGLFTVEYLVRIACVRKPKQYIFSFFGIIDLLSVLPVYIGLIVAQSHYLSVIRAIRLLRIFRILKLARYLNEAHTLTTALRASRIKISVFLGAVFTLVLIFGAIMYLIEGPKNGFTSIPVSMYWAVVTLTTVGYGDVTPHTVLGQTLAALIMVLGYGIIAVPTGIVTAELTRLPDHPVTTHGCVDCGRLGHDLDAKFCKFCGGEISLPKQANEQSSIR